MVAPLLEVSQVLSYIVGQAAKHTVMVNIHTYKKKKHMREKNEIHLVFQLMKLTTITITT
jgi:hypothetical protein